MLVQSPRDFGSVMERLEGCNEIVVDTETTGLDWRKDHVVGVSVLMGADPFYFPFRHEMGENLSAKNLESLINGLNKIPVHGGFNYSFDIKMLWKEGLVTPAKSWDAMLMAYLMNENEESFKLESLAEKYTNPQAGKEEEKLIDLIRSKFGGGKRSAKGHLWRLRPEEVGPYAEQDVLTTKALYDFYLPRIEKWHLAEVMKDIFEYRRVLTIVESRGMRLDNSRLDSVAQQASDKCDQLERELQKMFERDTGESSCNINSPKQLKYWLGPRLGIGSTSVSELEKHDDDAAKLLLEYRAHKKIHSTYCEPYRRLQHGGVIHTNFRIAGTRTGRLSSSTPNLQNVPNLVRQLFVPRSGYVFAEFDYSQAELRLAAHYYKVLCNDPTLADILIEGRDYYAEVAKVTGLTRKQSKARVLALQFGAGANRLAAMHRTDLEKEQKFIRKFHETFPGIRKFQRMCQSSVEERGYLRYWTHRVRRFGPLDPTYKASNSIIQGGAAEILRTALVRCEALDMGRLILTVHDSLLFELPEEQWKVCCLKIAAAMEDFPWLEVPMKVDCKIGKSWGELTYEGDLK